MSNQEKPIKKDDDYYMDQHAQYCKRYLDEIKCETSEQLKQEIDKVLAPILDWINSPKTKQKTKEFWEDLGKGEPKGFEDDKEYEKESTDFYGKSADAIVKVLVLASNYVYHVMGSSGFQASWADMQYMAVRRMSKFGFMIIEADDFLFPLFKEKYEEFKTKTLNNPEVIEYLKNKLEESLEKGTASPNVQLHWKEIIDAYENKQWLKDREAEYDAKLKKWREENPDWNKWGKYVKPAGQNAEATKTVEEKTEDE